MSWLRSYYGDAAVRRVAIGLLVLVATAGLYAFVSATFLRASAAEAAVAPSQAAALVAATSGDRSTEVQAIGEKAQLINASMPFSRAPVQAARAFVLPAGESLDQRRALLCLTQAVYYEAGFEPMGGRRAVAQVVLNRMRHPAFPKSVCGVVYQRNSTPVCQFSFVCDGALDRRPEAGAWKVAEDIARAALAGFVENSVGSATHYHADYVAPR
ncbi:MAG: cell wall hydrolase, partial [Hyphomicrobium sp.]|nr:cell wall hydrolase [Hyphomicrobium sp.]